MFSLATLAIGLALLPAAFSQNTGDDIVYDAQHNITSLYSTWSTGSMNVVTGSGFAKPAEAAFVYPKTTGVSFSFSPNGWFEHAQYSFVSNASDPSCITGYMLWTHGTFTENSNGSLTMSPNGDGYQQVQDACGAVSNFIENTNITISSPWWTITEDSERGHMLRMQKFDLTFYPPMFLVSTTPEMLPTEKLRNVTAAADFTARKRSLEEAPNGAAHSFASSLFVATGAFFFGLFSL